MKRTIILTLSFFFLVMYSIPGQTQQEALAIKQVALDYIESQHHVKPDQFERAAHPRMVKRTFWTNKKAGKEYLRETFTDAMILLAERYNLEREKFPEKEVLILDVFDKVASVKLIADHWIDYIHIVKLNGECQLVHALWQFNDAKEH